MKLVLSYTSGGLIFGYQEKTACIEYESKEKLLEDLEAAIKNARNNYETKRANYWQWHNSEPKQGTPEWDVWFDQDPDTGLQFSFAGQKFSLGEFGSIDEDVRLPDVLDLEEWFEFQKSQAESGES